MTTRIHRAWLVAGVTFLVLLASAAFRSSVGVMIVPFEDEFGWTRSATSLAVSVNLVVYGVTAPFAAALMERFGIRRIAAIALGADRRRNRPDPGDDRRPGSWSCSGASWSDSAPARTALVFGALVTSRWFVHRRGLVLGVLGAAWATGQLVFLPLHRPRRSRTTAGATPLAPSPSPASR